VPVANRIGEEGSGFFLQMLQFQEERLWGAANVLGGLEDAIRETTEYTRERHTFGRPILANQSVHFRLAELSTELEALRALVWRATELLVAGEDVTRLASMAKLKAGRLSREVADGCLQYWGGMGYMWESKISRLFRDGRLLSIGAGADEVMLGIICKLDGTLPRREKGE
jgi:citronellyl-CoA dehydrogenase